MSCQTHSRPAPWDGAGVRLNAPRAVRHDDHRSALIGTAHRLRT